jgi:hypothetical protein
MYVYRNIYDFHLQALGFPLEEAKISYSEAIFWI